MLQQMNLTSRQKRGDVQHLLARSFSVKNLPPVPLGSPTAGTGGGDLPKEISFRVPQFAGPGHPSSSRKQPSSLPALVETAETVSIGELSVEPCVLGGGAEEKEEEEGESKGQLIGVSSPFHPVLEGEDFPDEAGIASALKEEHRTSRLSSSSSSSCTEEQSVRTPLLETDEPSTMPVLSKPGVKHYDQMFSEKPIEDEIPLGGTADNLTSQP